MLATQVVLNQETQLFYKLYGIRIPRKKALNVCHVTLI